VCFLDFHAFFMGLRINSATNTARTHVAQRRTLCGNKDLPRLQRRNTIQLKAVEQTADPQSCAYSLESFNPRFIADDRPVRRSFLSFYVSSSRGGISAATTDFWI
jgi:hypothetical protein